eukprot:31406-Pelagococcus_subviridis.AAC.6
MLNAHRYAPTIAPSPAAARAASVAAATASSLAPPSSVRTTNRYADAASTHSCSDAPRNVSPHDSRAASTPLHASHASFSLSPPRGVATSTVASVSAYFTAPCGAEGELKGVRLGS